MHICMYVCIYIFLLYPCHIPISWVYILYIYMYIYIYIYYTYINAQSNPNPFFIDLIIQNPHSSWVDSYPNAQA